MPLTLRQLEDVCLVNDGSSQCRFVAEDDAGKYYCLKKTAAKDSIDEEIRLFKNKHKAAGTDPKVSGLPIGNNCGGYVFFKHKDQGYDV